MMRNFFERGLTKKHDAFTLSLPTSDLRLYFNDKEYQLAIHLTAKDESVDARMKDEK